MSDGGVLIVEDEFFISEMLSAMIEEMGLSVCGIAASADEAIRLARLCRPRLVLMDVRLKGPKDGVDAANEIVREMPAAVIYVTGSREPQNVARIQADHPSGVLYKPFQFQQLKEAVDRVLV